MFKKALIYLGLGPDEEYEQYVDADPGSVETVRPVRNMAAQQPAGIVQTAAAPAQKPLATVRPVAAGQRPQQSVSRPAPQSSPRPAGTASHTAGSAIKIVEPLTVKPHASSPTSFNEAQEIGDRFKAGQPVIVNLQGVDRDLRRRLIDFASGLCYALGGKMDKVATHVYMLTPADVEVSAADTRDALD